MNLARVVASLTFVVGLPLALLAAYAGYWEGLYDYGLVLPTFTVLVAVVFSVLLFGVLPALND